MKLYYLFLYFII